MNDNLFLNWREMIDGNVEPTFLYTFDNSTPAKD